MITDEEKQAILREHFSYLGKRAGEINRKKGSEYFKWVRSHGIQKKKEENRD